MFPFGRPTRRKFIQAVGAGLTALYLPGCATYGGRPRSETDFANDAPFAGMSPVDRSQSNRAPASSTEFSGDRPELAHRVLWNTESRTRKLAGLPPERVPLVIVGGGMSGLFSAYLLREFQPVLLERAERFGGNAKGESWQGVDYSIGAAYFGIPHPNSPADYLFKELDLSSLYRVKSGSDPVRWNGKTVPDFWSGDFDPTHKASYVKLSNYLRALNNSSTDPYPEIPFSGSTAPQWLRHLDERSLHDHLLTVLGSPLPEALEAAIEYYCWSSFGTSAFELSAAAGLNFLASETTAVAVAPGGNSAVAERLLERLYRTLPLSHLRTEATVFHLEADNDGVDIGYETSSGDLRRIRAQTVIAACPKFVIQRLMPNLEPDRKKAIAELSYRSYLVGNVLLKRRPKDSFYDLWMPEKLERNARKSAVTDVILGTYSLGPNPPLDSDPGVLTLYRPLAFDGARRFLLQPDAIEKAQKEFEIQIQEKILPALSLSIKEVQGLRLTRWGHPMPVARVGKITNGTPQLLRKPYRDRVFFVHQDNWMLPALETALSESFAVVPQIKKRLS